MSSGKYTNVVDFVADCRLLGLVICQDTEGDLQASSPDRKDESEGAFVNGCQEGFINDKRIIMFGNETVH